MQTGDYEDGFSKGDYSLMSRIIQFPIESIIKASEQIMVNRQKFVEEWAKDECAESVLADLAGNPLPALGNTINYTEARIEKNQKEARAMLLEVSDSLLTLNARVLDLLERS